MSQAPAPPLLTTAELRAIPHDGRERYLIRGRLRERAAARRNPQHHQIAERIVRILCMWEARQQRPRGVIASGEAGCTLRHDPDSTIDIDIFYVSVEVWARQPDHDALLIDGVPLLAVEILAPNAIQGDVNERVDEYLAVGVPLIWVVDPRFRTVRVHRPGAEPELFNVTQDLSGEPHLPEFRTPVAQLFP